MSKKPLLLNYIETSAQRDKRIEKHKKERMKIAKSEQVEKLNTLDKEDKVADNKSLFELLLKASIDNREPDRPIDQRFYAPKRKPLREV